MSMHQPNTDATSTISVDRIVSWEEAFEIATRLGRPPMYAVLKELNSTARQSIALLLLVQCGVGIEGHNYKSAKEPVFAAVNSENDSTAEEHSYAADAA